LSKFELNSNFVYVLHPQWQEIFFFYSFPGNQVFDYPSHPRLLAACLSATKAMCFCSSVQAFYSRTAAMRQHFVGKSGNIISAASISSGTIY